MLRVILFTAVFAATWLVNVSPTSTLKSDRGPAVDPFSVTDGQNLDGGPWPDPNG